MNDSSFRTSRNNPSFASSREFVDFVLALKPWLAVFDCDGTLWSGDGGQDFFYWEMAQKLIPDKVARWAGPRYDEYLAGKVTEEQMCGEMVTIHAGLRVAEIEQAAERFFTQIVEPRIFPEMQELARRLQAAGCEIWAVSSTNEWVIAAGVRRFGISRERVIAASVAVENGVATDRLIQVPTDDDKARCIREQIKRQPDAVLGNSMHDAAMLAMARHPLVINPNPDLAELAREKGWKIHWPQAALETAADLSDR